MPWLVFVSQTYVAGFIRVSGVNSREMQATSTGCSAITAWTYCEMEDIAKYRSH